MKEGEALNCWIGANATQGPMREAPAAELEEHANDEQKHAGMLAGGIIQLGGARVLMPEAWNGKSTTMARRNDHPSSE